MNEETDGLEAGAEVEAIADTSEVDESSEATAEQQTGADDTGAADDAGDEHEPPKRVPWFQKRIDEVTRQKYDAQREADYWRGLAEGRGVPNQQTPQAVQQTAGPPTEDQFDTWEQYEEARIAHHVEQRLRQAEMQRRQQQVLTTYVEREAAVKAAHPDYDVKVNDPTLPITPLQAAIIRESDRGPEIAYWLGTNRSEAAQIASLPPHLQAAALGRIEASLGSQAAKPVQNRAQPPAPPQTVAGISAGVNKDPSKMSMAEYAAWRQANP